MSKPIAYPSVSEPAYKGLVSEARTVLNRVAARLRSSPGAANDIRNQISAFLFEFGITPLVGSNQRILTSAVKVTAPAATGTYTNGYTFTIVNGAITAVVAS